jgi:TetR/AcrR family transcriptional regulator, cholesterol catabolism regulator
MESKERIIQKADELFKKFGIRSITMDDVARNIAVSKKTIYQFFKDKDELVTEVVRISLNHDMNCIGQMYEDCPTALDEIIAMSRYMKTNLANINPTLMYDMQRYHPRAWEIWNAHKRNFILNSVQKNLERGILEELYRPDIPIEALAILRLEEIQLSFNIDYFPATKYNFIEVNLAFMDHFVRGIVTPKGLTHLEKLQEQGSNHFFNNINLK